MRLQLLGLAKFDVWLNVFGKQNGVAKAKRTQFLVIGTTIHFGCIPSTAAGIQKLRKNRVSF